MKYSVFEMKLGFNFRFSLEKGKIVREDLLSNKRKNGNKARGWFLLLDQSYLFLATKISLSVS